VRLLLDTHALLWFLLDDERLSAAAKALIADSTNDIEISPASYWEIAIKISIRKYHLPEPLEIFLERELAANAFHILAIEPRHVAPLTSLPFHHRDPFDRLLIAQALAESIPIVSNDPVLDNYSVTRLW
jgi:PIN domain nuclease of toxin-antitoxin system